MITGDKAQLPRDSFGRPICPRDLPDQPAALLDLMDDALNYAEKGTASGAPAFDHGRRIFDQLKAHYDLHVSRELASAHLGLTVATNRLKLATWWLAAITVLLGLVEGVKLLGDR